MAITELPALSIDELLISRFAYVRFIDGTMVLRSPLTNVQVLIKHLWTIELLHLLTRPRTIDDLIRGISVEAHEGIRHFVKRCIEHGFLVVCKNQPDGRTDPLRTWEFHDLLYHAESRVGRQHQNFGATYRFGEEVTPELEAAVSDQELVELPSSAEIAHRISNTSLEEALTRRQSSRGWNALSLEQLGEFLNRTVRNRSRCVNSEMVSRVKRVYPSGGNIHPLEVYVLIQEAIGIEPGIYHYEPYRHLLERLRQFDNETSEMFIDAAAATGTPTDSVKTLFILTAKFHKTCWKYESIAYHLILLEVGALIQTMYLVATAMGLRPCAIGAGNSDRFARLIGHNYYRESSVSEFALGS